jgi:hypothetical protein
LREKPILKPISSITSCSPISYIVFSWLSPVLHRGAKLETLTQDDLPLLGANDRAPNLFDAIKRTEGRKGPSWMNGLLWRVLLVNKRLFAWRESALGSASSRIKLIFLTQQNRLWPVSTPSSSAPHPHEPPVDDVC